MSTLMAPSLVSEVPWWKLKVSSTFKFTTGSSESFIGLKFVAMFNILFLYTTGYVRTDWLRMQFFTPGETITLRVNISTAGLFHFVYFFDITQLTWFHNGREVAANCTGGSGKFIVNAMGTELNITNTTSSDSGWYTVRVSSTTYGGRCDSLWLPPLEHYTAHAPVTYTLRERGKLLLNCNMFYFITTGCIIK